MEYRRSLVVRGSRLSLAVIEAVKEGKKEEGEPEVVVDPSFLNDEFYGGFDEEKEVPKFDEE